MDFKEINPLWSLADPLTVQQAAALIAGFDPNAVRFNSDDAAYFENETGLTDSYSIAWVQTAFAALTNAINGGKLRATIRRSAWERGWDEAPDYGERFTIDIELLSSDIAEAWEADPTYARRRGIIYRVEPDWSKTTIERDNLRIWLKARASAPAFSSQQRPMPPITLTRRIPAMLPSWRRRCGHGKL
ncbi:hypothetical protein [Nitrosococcus wardiae]|uniref:Uncharacterized protein n=1 Tax=Nitrosococcus wardiae TaxID=1814290 RepID=A0A4P7C2X5_9GAMM|nr:hypothetical protein [Nitrosococcus wardiae]QBQ56109.1 hypothetical protein E3U44_17525 [Nitrosococcus wardiae]